MFTFGTGYVYIRYSYVNRGYRKGYIRCRVCLHKIYGMFSYKVKVCLQKV